MTSWLALLHLLLKSLKRTETHEIRSERDVPVGGVAGVNTLLCLDTEGQSVYGPAIITPRFSNLAASETRESDPGSISDSCLWF